MVRQSRTSQLATAGTSTRSSSSHGPPATTSTPRAPTRAKSAAGGKKVELKNDGEKSRKRGRSRNPEFDHEGPTTSGEQDEAQEEAELKDGAIMLSEWWIVKKKSNFLLKLSLKREMAALTKSLGEQHVRILSIGREHLYVWCPNPQFLMAILEFEDGSTLTVKLKTGGLKSGFKSSQSDAPFNQMSLSASPASIDLFVKGCNSILPAIHIPTAPPKMEKLEVDIKELKATIAKKKSQPTKKTRTRRRDKATLFGDGDDISDIDDSKEQIDVKVTKAIEAAKKLYEAVPEQEDQELCSQENAIFQQHLKVHEGGFVAGYAGFFQSAHDLDPNNEKTKKLFELCPKSLMIDRVLDQTHSDNMVQNAKLYRHLSLHGHNYLALYLGSVDKFKAESAKMKQKVEAARNAGHEITIDTKQTIIDIPGKSVIIGGMHRVDATQKILAECNDDAELAVELYGKYLFRPMVSVYCTSAIDDDGKESALTPFDIQKLARSHNRPAPALDKKHFEYVMSLRADMMFEAELSHMPLCTDLPSSWTRADTQKMFNKFCKTQFPLPACQKDHDQFDKAKDLAEMSGVGFQHLMWIYQNYNDTMVTYMPNLQPTSNVEGGHPQLKFPQIIDRNHVGAPLNGLAPEAREKIVEMFRVLLEKRIDIIKERKYGAVSELLAVQKAFIAKTIKQKHRQMFLFGFGQKHGIKDLKQLKKRFPLATRPENYDHLLSKSDTDQLVRGKKNPTDEHFPKRWMSYYLNAPKNEPTATQDQSDKTSVAKASSNILREGMFGCVVIVHDLQFATARSARPNNVRFTGVSTIVLFELSTMTAGPSLLESIHTDLAETSDFYSLICLNDDIHSLATFVQKYGYKGITFYLQPSQNVKKGRVVFDSSDFRFGNVQDPFSYITILSYFRPDGDCRIVEQLNIGKMPRLLQGDVLDLETIVRFVDLLTPKHGWVLDCAGYICNDLALVAKATQRASKLLHLLVWTPENTISEPDLDALQDELESFRDKEQEGKRLIVHESLSVDHMNQKAEANSDNTLVQKAKAELNNDVDFDDLCAESNGVASTESTGTTPKDDSGAASGSESNFGANTETTESVSPAAASGSETNVGPSTATTESVSPAASGSETNVGPSTATTESMSPAASGSETNVGPSTATTESMSSADDDSVAAPSTIDAPSSVTTESTADTSNGHDVTLDSDNNESSGSEAEIIGCVELDLPPFTPVAFDWQESVSGDIFSLEVFAPLEYYGKGLPIRSSIPVETGIHDVVSDGNCLFRSLSVVLTGDESKHHVIRENICTYVEENPDNYLEILGDKTVEHYVERMSTPCENVNQRNKWGGDKEMRMFANLTSTDVWVYMPKGVPNQLPGWQCFKSCTRNELCNSVADLPYEAVYLRNQQFHYQVVTEVESKNDDRIQKRGPEGSNKQLSLLSNAAIESEADESLDIGGVSNVDESLDAAGGSNADESLDASVSIANVSADTSSASILTPGTVAKRLKIAGVVAKLQSNRAEQDGSLTPFTMAANYCKQQIASIDSPDGQSELPRDPDITPELSTLEKEVSTTEKAISSPTKLPPPVIDNRIVTKADARKLELVNASGSDTNSGSKLERNDSERFQMADFLLDEKLSQNVTT